jgi:Zn-dependent M28 family amino/carboxypeptidase
MNDRTAGAGRRRLGAVLVALAAVVALLATAPGATAISPEACAKRVNNVYHKLLTCVTLEGVRAHQAAFQAIADANDDPDYPGTRAPGTEGYAESVAYVAGLLEDAGYDVTMDEFEFSFNFPVLLQQLTPVNAVYPSGSYTNAGIGDVTGAVTPVDINLVPPRASTSGCEAADFAGFPAGTIALIQRGTCTFAAKALNAQAAGATAVIIFNQGNTPAREGLIVGTLAPSSTTIPVVGASYAQGESLAQPGSTARVHVRAPELRTDVNVLAELTGRNDGNVVMAGGHLDSVTDGPGINDNGSGAAALLETALMMAKLKPENTLRFAWWGAEEEGLIGSQAYVDGLSAGELERIALYLNYDMIGSPNYIFMVYDADQSTFPAPPGVPIPDGSAAIEDVFESFYTDLGEPYDDTEFSGRSDYEAFILAGIPSSGLFTGAEGVKTPAQQAIWGGTAGEQFDPCYHLACDTFANNSNHALDVNSDAVAFAMLTFAYSTESVNGVRGKRMPGNPKLTAPAGPQGTFQP